MTGNKPLARAAELASVVVNHEGDHEGGGCVTQVCQSDLPVMRIAGDPKHRPSKDRDHEAKPACQAARPEQQEADDKCNSAKEGQDTRPITPVSSLSESITSPDYRS